MLYNRLSSKGVTLKRIFVKKSLLVDIQFILIVSTGKNFNKKVVAKSLTCHAICWKHYLLWCTLFDFVLFLQNSNFLFIGQSLIILQEYNSLLFSLWGLKPQNWTSCRQYFVSCMCVFHLSRYAYFQIILFLWVFLASTNLCNKIPFVLNMQTINRVNLILSVCYFGCVHYRCQYKIVSFNSQNFLSASQCNLACFWGNLGLFCSFSLKLPHAPWRTWL